MAKKRLYLKIFGDVQGVGFRYYSAERARELGLVGWVRNLSTGTLECEIEGEDEDLKKFLKWAKRGPELARVDRVEERWKEVKNCFRDFEIKSA